MIILPSKCGLEIFRNSGLYNYVVIVLFLDISSLRSKI